MKSSAPTVADYLKELEPERRKVLGELRALIKQGVPKAAETMSYGMPTYELGRQVCAIASQKQYLALYVCETEALDEYRDDFAHLNVGKSCIRP